jgi:ATP-dependent Clp protease ATP-binding subunit ClpA
VNPREPKIAGYRASVATARLSELNLDLDELRGVLASAMVDERALVGSAAGLLLPRASGVGAAELRRSKECLKIFNLAEALAGETGNETVRPVHLLVGLLRCGDPAIGQALSKGSIEAQRFLRIAQESADRPPAQLSSGPVITNAAILAVPAPDPSKLRSMDAVAIANALKEKVVGQDVICDEIAKAIRRSVAQEKNVRPMGIFLLAGTSGTGKTFTAKCLAQAMGRALVHFDMAKYDQAHNASRLFGSPPGYQGSNQPGELTKRLEEAPDAVVLLDEFEKAHDAVHKQFLTAFNDGFFDDMATGRQVKTNRAIFILTTNAASDGLLKAADMHGDDRESFLGQADHLLRDEGFAPEVLSRLHDIFCFRPFTAEGRRKLIVRSLIEIAEIYGAEITSIDAKVILAIEERFKSLGNRASARSLTDLLYRMIADTLIDMKDQEVHRVSLDMERGRVVALAAN